MSEQRAPTTRATGGARPKPWSVAEYGWLCRAALDAGYEFGTLAAYAAGDVRAPVLVARHDVDRQPWNAVRMAECEAALGITATYYIRMVGSAYDADAVRALAALGHEIGYHYEVLATTRGDVERALALFAAELARLRALAPVVSASAHGSPLSPHDSLAIWERASPGDFALEAEAYLSLDYQRLAYFTDTGRAWDADRTNLRDRANTAGERPRVATTAELAALLAGAALPEVCVQTHPERWNDAPLSRLRSQAWDAAANGAKLALAALGRRRG